jgi:hypothetical protein
LILSSGCTFLVVHSLKFFGYPFYLYLRVNLVSLLCSFIENYGTHIITSVTVGGKDEVYIKQHSSSQLSELEFKNYVREIGKERFSDVENKSNAATINYSEKVSKFLTAPAIII